MRANVEHGRGVIKRVFGFVKVRYRGLAKNTSDLMVTRALGIVRGPMTREWPPTLHRVLSEGSGLLRRVRVSSDARKHRLVQTFPTSPSGRETSPKAELAPLALPQSNDDLCLDWQGEDHHDQRQEPGM